MREIQKAKKLPYSGKGACSWCAVSAVDLSTPKDTSVISHVRNIDEISILITERCLVNYNDRKATRHEDIMTLFDWAIGIEEAGGL